MTRRTNRDPSSNPLKTKIEALRRLFLFLFKITNHLNIISCFSCFKLITVKIPICKSKKGVALIELYKIRLILTFQIDHIATD